MTEQAMYQVGDVACRESDDPLFGDLFDALGFASTWSFDKRYDGDTGVWIAVWRIRDDALPQDVAVVNACAPSGPVVFWSEFQEV